MRIRVGVLSLLIVGLVSVARAQDTTTASARELHAWLHTFNAGNRDSIVAFQARWLQRRAFERWIGCGSARNSLTPNWRHGGKRCWQ